MTITVRIAELKDLDWIVNSASVNMIGIELQRPDLIYLPRLYQIVEKGIGEKTFFLAEDGDVPVGVLGSLLSEHLLNPSVKLLTELLWYVLPEYRKTRAGFLLFKYFDNTAKQIAHESVLSILTASSEINIDSLEKRGFKLNEFAFNRRY